MHLQAFNEISKFISQPIEIKNRLLLFVSFMKLNDARGV